MFEDGPEASTPIDADEAGDLLPPHLHNRAELNAWEQANILVAAQWVQRTRKRALAEPTIRLLHSKMFDETWGWAGKYRKSDKNIGVFWAQVPTEVRQLVDDGTYWVENGTYPIDEAALRLHHRLAMIHPFPNGNGRHARLWCDLLLKQHNRAPFEWKTAQLDQPGDARRQYIDALQQADGGRLDPLFELFLADGPRNGASQRGPHT